jgi:hypothetical protein
MKIYDRIVTAIGAKLAEDGFTSPSGAGIFVKQIVGPWRAWVSIPGDSFTLDPMAGIMNDELNDIRLRACEMAGQKTQRRLDSPPIIMVDLERLAADCPACSKDAPWEYHEEILTVGVADNLVTCLRTFAYPFFEKYASLQSLMDASKERMPSFGFPWFAPIILIKLGRVDDAKTYAGNYARFLPDDEHGSEYRKYVEKLFKMPT